MRYFEKIALDTAVSHTKSQSDFLENSGYKKMDRKSWEIADKKLESSNIDKLHELANRSKTTGNILRGTTGLIFGTALGAIGGNKLSSMFTKIKPGVGVGVGAGVGAATGLGLAVLSSKRVNKRVDEKVNRALERYQFNRAGIREKATKSNGTFFVRE